MKGKKDLPVSFQEACRDPIRGRNGWFDSLDVNPVLR